MKRLLFVFLAVLALPVLAGCGAKSDESETPPANTETYLTSEDVPLDDAAPDFLTAAQQTLYRQAAALYNAMFGGETLGIDDRFPAPDRSEPAEYTTFYTPDGSDSQYLRSEGCYQS